MGLAYQPEACRVQPGVLKNHLQLFSGSESVVRRQALIFSSLFVCGLLTAPALAGSVCSGLPFWLGYSRAKNQAPVKGCSRIHGGLICESKDEVLLTF